MARKANNTQACINISQSAASRSRKVIAPICCVLVRLYLDCCVQFGAPSTRKISTRKILTYTSEYSRGHPKAQRAGARLKEMTLFSLMRKRQRIVLIAICNYLIRDYV